MPSGIAVDSAGNVFVANATQSRVRKIEPNGSVSTVAGTGEEGYSGDGNLATKAMLDEPRGIAVDEAGNLYVADAMWDVIRKRTEVSRRIARWRLDLDNRRAEVREEPRAERGRDRLGVLDDRDIF